LVTTAIDRSAALALDSADPLANFRSEFLITDESVCYLDGNSLGRLPRQTVQAINATLDVWADEGVLGWAHWVNSAQRVGDLLGEVALGAAAGQTLVCDTTSVNLYQLCGAAITARPGRRTIITDAANFPTDRYILQGLAEQHGMRLVVVDNESDAQQGELITAQQLAPYLNDDVALVTLQVVQYRAGARHDVRAITDLVRKHGALMVWDAAHAVGSVELDLDDTGVDLAVGCTYKYLNSGPGAPAWMYVNHRVQAEVQVPIRGWFAQREQFQMGANFDRADGIRGFQVASPSLLGTTSVESSLQMLKRAGMPAVAAKAVAGTEMMISLFDTWLAPLGMTLLTPRDASKRGGHITLGHPDALAISTALRTKHSVITDYRVPDSIRVAMSPLATSYAEVWDGFQRIRECLLTQTYLDGDLQAGTVT
jgi:kynureninase